METTGDKLDMHNYEEERDDKLEQMDIQVEEVMSRSRPCSRRINRYMNQAPEFVTRLNAFVEVTAGTNVVFACQWKSLVKPSVKWYKDDQEVTEDERYKVVALEDGVENLLIEDPRRADEGTYKCKAENHEGVASTTGYLSVTGDVRDKPLSAQPRRNQSEHVVSHAPALRAIQEQKSLEEREEVEYSSLPPSPLTEFINTVRREHSWPFARSGYNPGDEDDYHSDSDTSVESQEYERVTIDFRDEDDSDEMESKPPPSYDEVQALRKLQAEIEEATAREMSDSSHPVPHIPDHNDDGLFIDNDNKKTPASAQDGQQQQLIKDADTIDETNTKHNKTVGDNDIILSEIASPVFSARPDSSEINSRPSESLEDVLRLGLCDLYDGLTQPPFLYYAFFVSFCTLVGCGLELSPPLFVLIVAFLAFISFQLLKLEQREERKS